MRSGQLSAFVLAILPGETPQGQVKRWSLVRVAFPKINMKVPLNISSSGVLNIISPVIYLRKLDGIVRI